MNVRIFKLIGVLGLGILLLASGFFIFQTRSQEENKMFQTTPAEMKRCDLSQTAYNVEMEVLDAVSEKRISNASIVIRDSGNLWEVTDCYIVITPQPIVSVKLKEDSNGKYIGEVIGSAKVQKVEMLVRASGYQPRQISSIHLDALPYISVIRLFPEGFPVGK